jgi:hypothetical protein
MSSPDLLRPLELRGFAGSNDRVVGFGVLGGPRSGPTLLVHSPALLVRLDQLDEDVERVVFVEGLSPDAATLATIDSMLRAIGPQDGLVQFQMAAEAIKLTREPQMGGATLPPAVLIERGVDRSNVVSFRPPEVLRTSALLAALAKPPSEEWVNPAGLIIANGGWIETYPS